MWRQATLQLTVSLLNYIEMSPTRTRTKHLDTILSFLLNPFICPRNITICSPAGKFNTGGSHEANQTWFVKFSPESNSTTSLDFVCKSKKVINNKIKPLFPSTTAPPLQSTLLLFLHTPELLPPTRPLSCYSTFPSTPSSAAWNEKAMTLSRIYIVKRLPPLSQICHDEECVYARQKICTTV